MSAEDVPRDRAMEGRVGRTLEEAGLAPDHVRLVQTAHRLAMERRSEGLRDPHHPDFLHPGRTVLILALDTGFRDPAGLAAAALAESERTDLAVERALVRDRLGGEVADRLGEIPVAPDTLAEELVTATVPVRMVALAERLDHCRHAKFWPDLDARARILEQARSILGPVADRTDAALARRFTHWIGAFERALEREVRERG